MRPITASGRRYDNSGGNTAILWLFEHTICDKLLMSPTLAMIC
jgi:hypothetical protein